MPGGMEEIARLRSQRKQYKEATGRDLEIEDKTPEEPDTLSTIFADPSKQALFGRLLKRLIPETSERDAIWQKYLAKEPLSEEEDEKLDKARYALAEGEKLIEDIGEIFDEEDVKSAAARNPEFARYVSKYGAERMTELARLQVPALAMEDPRGLRKIVNSLKEADKIQASPQYRFLNAELIRLQEKHNWSDDTMAGILELKGRNREIQVRELVKKQYTGFWAAIDWLSKSSGGSGGLSQMATDKALTTIRRVSDSQLRKDIDKHLGNIGKALALSITNDAPLLRALQEELLGGEPASLEQAETVKSLDDLKRAERPLTQGAVIQRWNKEKDNRAHAMFGARNFNGLADDSQKDLVRDSLISDMKKEHGQRGHGIFVQIFEMVARMFMSALETNKRSILK